MSPSHEFDQDLSVHCVSNCTPTVFVIDGDISVRESLDLLIRSEGWHAEILEPAQECFVRTRQLTPSCLILDVSLGGLELQKRIACEMPDLPIILLSGLGDIRLSVQAMKAGAVDFLVKPFRNDVLLRSIRESLERSRVVLERKAALRDLSDGYASLTPRERQVMALVVSGLLNKQVGGELGIAEQTVKAHRGQVMQKMKADSLAHLVRMASRLDPMRQAIQAA